MVRHKKKTYQLETHQRLELAFILVLVCDGDGGDGGPVWAFFGWQPLSLLLTLLCVVCAVWCMLCTVQVVVAAVCHLVVPVSTQYVYAISNH